jgi:addiction module RelE/StbE family toxin
MRRAQRDREDIYAYIARRDPARDSRVLAVIATAVNRLADFPALGRPGRKPGTRELVIPRLPYIVIYRVRGERVQILRVLHTARERPGMEGGCL